MASATKEYPTATVTAGSSERMSTSIDPVASRFCLQKCPTAGCAGVCNRILDDLGGHAGYTHHCAGGHEWS